MKSVLRSPWFLLLLALVFRLAFLGQESIWNDEAITIRDSLLAPREIIGGRWDPHPPMYYLLLHYWLKLSEEVVFLRIPSAIFGALSVSITYAIGVRVASRKVAWLVALLLAASPLHIWYSQEVRMYALVVMWGVASTYLWVLLLQTSKRRLWLWFFYVIATSLGLYSHYTMGLLLLGQNLFTLASWWAKSKSETVPIKEWALAQLALALLYIPWLPVLPDHWKVIRNAADYPFWILSSAPALVGMAAGCAALFVAIVKWRRRSIASAPNFEKGVMVVLWGAAAVYLILSLLALSNRMTTLKRQTLILFPFVCLSLGVLLSTRIKRWQYWMAGLIAFSSVVSLISGFTFQKPRWNEIVAIVEAEAIPSDVVVLIPQWIGTTFDYYHEGDLAVETIIPNGVQAGQQLSRFDSAWLIINRKFERWQDPNQSVRNWFASQYELETERRFGEMELLYYRLQPTTNELVQTE